MTDSVNPPPPYSDNSNGDFEVVIRESLATGPVSAEVSENVAATLAERLFPHLTPPPVEAAEPALQVNPNAQVVTPSESIPGSDLDDLSEADGDEAVVLPPTWIANPQFSVVPALEDQSEAQASQEELNQKVENPNKKEPMTIRSARAATLTVLVMWAIALLIIVLGFDLSMVGMLIAICLVSGAAVFLALGFGTTWFTLNQKQTVATAASADDSIVMAALPTVNETAPTQLLPTVELFDQDQPVDGIPVSISFGDESAEPTETVSAVEVESLLADNDDSEVPDDLVAPAATYRYPWQDPAFAGPVPFVPVIVPDLDDDQSLDPEQLVNQEITGQPADVADDDVQIVNTAGADEGIDSGVIPADDGCSASVVARTKWLYANRPDLTVLDVLDMATSA
ncbi:MAG: hypothetical protein WCI47_00700 [bacterium]